MHRAGSQKLGFITAGGHPNACQEPEQMCLMRNRGHLLKAEGSHSPER